MIAVENYGPEMCFMPNFLRSENDVEQSFQKQLISSDHFWSPKNGLKNDHKIRRPFFLINSLTNPNVDSPLIQTLKDCLVWFITYKRQN
jgi:hypothetical protein